jgi:hypothetical protein
MPNRRRPKDASSLRHNLRERDGRLFWQWDPAPMRHAAAPADSTLWQEMRTRPSPMPCSNFSGALLRPDEPELGSLASAVADLRPPVHDHAHARGKIR